MSLYRTQQGEVSHADSVPVVHSVPSRREAIKAFSVVISSLSFQQVDDLDKHIAILRDFLWSR